MRDSRDDVSNVYEVLNLDARHRPELEVDIEILVHPDDVPGFYYARARPELEVELILIDDLIDAWFVDDDAVLDDCA